jgi:hypothetical protein
MEIKFSKNKYITITVYSLLVLSVLVSYSGLEHCLPQNPFAFWLLAVGWVFCSFVWFFRGKNTFLSLWCFYNENEIDISILVVITWAFLMDVRVIGIPLIRLVFFS